MDFENFLKQLEEITELMLDWEDVIQIGYPPRDADAMIAASILGRTFAGLDQSFVLFPANDITTQIKQRKHGELILLGFDEQEILESRSEERDLIIIPHASEKATSYSNTINTGTFGYSGLNTSISAVTYFLCNPIANETTLPVIAVLPLIALQTKELMVEYQDMENVNDLHGIIARDAQSDGIIELSKGFTVQGSEIFSIHDALIFSEQPFLPGLTGNTDKVTQLLAKSGIVVETSQGERSITDLDQDEIKDLNSNLITHLIQHKGHQEEKLVFIKTKTKLVREAPGSILHNTWDFGQAVTDAINRDRQTTALAVLLGNRTDRLRQLSKTFKEERRTLSISFQLLTDKIEDISELSHLRYLRTDRKVNWYNASLTAAMGLSSELIPTDKPLAILVPGPRDLMTVGVRASKNHNLRGDLGVLIIDAGENYETNNEQGSKLSGQINLPPQQVDQFITDLNRKMEVDTT